MSSWLDGSWTSGACAPAVDASIKVARKTARMAVLLNIEFIALSK
jgi:hypothetical protein